VRLAEFFGISEGDGHIPKDMYKMTITSNGLEEKEYIEYVKEMMENIFNKTPKTMPHNDSNALDLIIYGKNNVGGLVKKGLIPGDKVKNQISTAPWISKKQEYKLGNLRGKADSDGSIFVKRAQKSIRIGFQNHSKPLVHDFKDLCESFDIKTGRVTTYIRTNPDKEKKYKQYDILVAAKSEVSKFLDIIKPKKWEYRAETLGLTLISLNDPQKRNAIEKELYKEYPDKRSHYTDEYKDLLKNLCKKHGYEVHKESIIKAIENAFTNKHTGNLSIHAKNLIDELKERWK